MCIALSCIGDVAANQRCGVGMSEISKVGLLDLKLCMATLRDRKRSFTSTPPRYAIIKKFEDQTKESNAIADQADVDIRYESAD